MSHVSLRLPSGPASARFLQALQTNDQLTSVRRAIDSGLSYELPSARVVGLQLAMNGGTDATELTLAYAGFSEAGRKTSVDSDADMTR
jgi:hypothetical protein